MSSDDSDGGRYGTAQEKFWQGQFGDDYVSRNTSDEFVQENIVFFNNIFSLTGRPNSVLEFGPNTGMNLRAIHEIDPNISLSGVEINRQAAQVMAESLPNSDIHVDSFLEFSSDRKWNLVFCKGVLIHIAPNRLSEAYKALYQHSSDYILIAEYYNTTPTEVSYRGHSEKMFKRDFCGEMLDQYSDLSVVDYGFIYHRDSQFKYYDDITWFLLKKKI
jgi:pseudaminic acid biosynthesis-associated methylase